MEREREREREKDIYYMPGIVQGYLVTFMNKSVSVLKAE